MLESYLNNIAQISAHNDQREESYYAALADLISNFASSINRSEISVTILPKKTDAGNPDFRIWDGENSIVGYIEAKIPDSDLNKIEKTAQIERYRDTFPNVILTDFFEFRLYRNSELIEKIKIDEKITLDENTLKIEKILNRFFDFSFPKIYTSESLAVELAKRTKFLRDEIISIELQNADSKNYIRGFYNAFKNYLINGIKEYEFADLYSQTITYGLFAAKTRCKPEDTFNRRNAVYYIPQTIGILRDVFEFISLGKPPKQMEVIIDDISEVLSVADATKLLNDYYNQGKGEDPIIHFYETFLNKYDPSTRERRGVYYTPEPVVKYIVNSVDKILIQDFKKIGFADTSIKVLDPAAGTLTFLAEATKKAIKTYINNYGDGEKKGFIKRHILKNFYAFELMMAPYAIGHLNISYILKEEGYTLSDDDRFQLYLTNTLDAKVVDMPELPGLSTLAEEATEANRIRREESILAIIGNPPYSFDSYNKSEFENELMKYYKEDVKNERNIKILSDDYIKFIRFCHWKIEQNKQGVIGLITKNTYLNIAAAKGMRKKLLLTFDEIYILNIHGKLYEKTPDGSKDQNVFDIRVGTAILFLIKSLQKKKNKYAKLFYKDLYGDRSFKFDFLNTNDLFSTFSENDELEIDENHYFFEKKIFINQDIYKNFWAIDEIFCGISSGISTGRDHFVTDEKKNELIKRITNFINTNDSEDKIKRDFNIDNRIDFNIKKAKDFNTKFDIKKIKKMLYKPYVDRYIYYDKYLLTRDRHTFMNYFESDNLGLVITKRQGSDYFNNIFITNKMICLSVLGVGCYVIPLWLYKENGDAFHGNGHNQTQVSNINPKFEELLQNTYNKQNISEEIFYYIYAILFSNTYRKSFPELLKIDYPKIPFTKNFHIFEKMSELGKELADLHLLKSEKLNKSQVKFQGIGNGAIEEIEFNQNKKVVNINKTQFFDNISFELWEYEIGKNKVIQQWFRRKEKIDFEDVIELSKISTSLYETLGLQKEIDEIYPEILNELIEK